MFGISKLFRGLNLPGLAQALGDGSVRDQRAAFAAILVATAANVGQKQNFNLEVEINDLWTRLSNLRQEQPKGIGGAVSNVFDPAIFQGLNKSLEGLIKKIQ